MKLIVVLCAALASAYAPQNPAQPAAEERIEWVCPMDPDVRSNDPGRCRKCGMALVAGLPDPKEYRVDIDIQPRLIRAGQPADLTFRVIDPDAGKAVTKFDLVHEKYFHLFVVSRNLAYFAHEHPESRPDGSFVFRFAFPQTGEYRLLADFYPAGATPQMIARSVIVPGSEPQAVLAADLDPKELANLRVRVRTQPAQPIAGQKTILFFDVGPSDGLEPYLGAWGHMLIASADLIDMIHSHPAFEDAGATIQFNVIFPRPGLHRIWVQFQRRGIVNTAAFTVPVSELR
ncbi:MAG TPA: heavy metal-binding domain-containing protein [Bryobacteraceae bacterium]|nr:heavy metal-binding domain-containing protein [Bryobacteraceae bacterium]